MDLKQYVYPIYSGGTIIGQCFIADGYLITAAHVIKDFPACYSKINGKKIEFPKVYSSLAEEPFIWGEKPFFNTRGQEPCVAFAIILGCFIYNNYKDE